MRILVVEDNPAEATMAKDYIQSSNPDAVFMFASTVASGLREAATVNFGVIVLDLTLADSSPEQTLSAFSAVMRRIPTVVWASLECLPVGIDAIGEGAASLAQKANPSSLEAAIAALRNGVRP